MKTIKFLLLCMVTVGVAPATFAQNATVGSIDQVVQTLDRTTTASFAKDLAEANVVYFGEVHKEKKEDRDTTEFFRTSILPILFSLKFSTFYIEALPYFKDPTYSILYSDLYSKYDEIREQIQKMLISAPLMGKNASSYQKLVSDMIQHKINLFGFGINAMSTDASMDASQMLETITNRAVEAVRAENDKQKNNLKMVLQGGSLHNDSASEVDEFQPWIAGDRIKKIDPTKRVVNIDIMPVSFLLSKSTSTNVLVDLNDKIYKLQYLVLIEGKFKQVTESKLPTLIKVPVGKGAKNFCDYVILIP